MKARVELRVPTSKRIMKKPIPTYCNATPDAMKTSNKKKIVDQLLWQNKSKCPRVTHTSTAVPCFKW